MGCLLTSKKQIGRKLRANRKTSRSQIEDSSLTNSIRLNSSSKISRLLGAIKKQKDQPSENIYVRYHIDNLPQSTGSQLSQRYS